MHHWQIIMSNLTSDCLCVFKSNGEQDYYFLTINKKAVNLCEPFPYNVG